MFAEFESFIHRLKRRFDRAEWAIRHFDLSVAEDSAEKPGLLLIQIDGFARGQFERAVKEGRMPFLKSLMEDDDYRLRTFYPGLPSTTPAVQAELYWGVRAHVPAFSFRHKERGELGSLFNHEWAAEFEDKAAAQATGLLDGGSSWSNIYSGGAAVGETHFCVSRLGLGDIWRNSSFWNVFSFAVLQVPALVKIVALFLLEFVIGLGDAVAGIIRGRHLGMELGMMLSRMCVGVALREVMTIGGKVDVARGLPIVHVNFVGYDESSHRRGPGSAFAHWTLRGIDRAIRYLYDAANRSQRRDYHVWVFSDHGQERTRSFASEFPGGIEGIIASCMDLPPVVRKGRRARHALTRPVSRRWAQRVAQKMKAAALLPDREEWPFEFAGMGPVGHLYFRKPMSDAAKESLAARLVREGSIPSVLLRAEDGTITLHYRSGTARVPDDMGPLLQRHPEYLREEIARDFVGLCENEHAGDLILLGWNPHGLPWTFPVERGAHAGPGPEELQGFLLTPPHTDLPEGEYIRPDALRIAAMESIGRHPSKKKTRVHTPATLRVMSYNVHACAGMDGRVSPRRVARVIAQQSPDLVALQELDCGRVRSRGEDQVRLIADALGYHAVFCPTVIRGEEQYGHAVLSHFPLEAVKTAQLPYSERGVWPEDRAALWTRVLVGDLRVNVVTTHLGLGAAERMAQIRALLGPDWLEPVLGKEAILLCGDFNFTPGTSPYQLATGKLRDVASDTAGVYTFSTLRPLVRLDHIFLSEHFATKKVRSVRNKLTRVASDHLPLVADLELAVKATPSVEAVEKASGAVADLQIREL